MTATRIAKRILRATQDATRAGIAATNAAADARRLARNMEASRRLTAEYRSAAADARRDRVNGILIFFAFAAAVTVLVGGYVELDNAGMQPHTAQTTITVPRDWIVGETKTCVSQGAAAFQFVDCGGVNEKAMTVTFWGREQQPEYSTVNWDCERDSDHFTCREASGSRR